VYLINDFFRSLCHLQLLSNLTNIVSILVASQLDVFDLCMKCGYV